MNCLIVTVLAGITLAAALPSLSKSEGRFDAETDVIVNLFTRKNPTTPQVLKYGDEQNLLASNFQAEKPLKIFNHGWSRQAAAPEFVSAFLEAGDVNVIIVDWTKGTVGEESVVVANAPLVGKFMGNFIDWCSTFGLKHSDVHVVGMSLGSHVAGWTGRSCQKGKVEIVTACDPSRKFWDDSDDKVNAGDGKYVEIIHTNTLHHGLIYPTGTADFYPNGGTTQPGCNNNYDCDHMRALALLVDSIDHQKFVAQKCNNYDEIVNGNCASIGTSYMGGTGVAKNASGVYFLTTNAVKPFYQG